jgi:hypothetical protein
LDVATGRERHRLEGHRHHVVSLAFSADGKRLLSGSQDTTALVWDVSRLAKEEPHAGGPLSSEKLEALWAALGSGDAAKAYQAEAPLTTAPKDTVAFLKGRLQATPEPSPEGVPALIADLDADDFAVREKAAGELEKLGPAARPALQKSLKGQPPLELRRRIERVLERLPDERLQAWRALEVLEHIDTPESRQLLEKLAAGPADAYLTKEAKAITRRLASKQH